MGVDLGLTVNTPWQVATGRGIHKVAKSRREELQGISATPNPFAVLASLPTEGPRMRYPPRSSTYGESKVKKR